MVTEPSGTPRVVAFPLAFLVLSMAFEHRRIQVQTMAFGTRLQPLHHPLRYRLEEALHFPHPKTQKQIANRVITGEPIDPQQTMQRPVAPQPTGLREPPRSRRYRDEIGDVGFGPEGSNWEIDG
jgi:hypothetical protein